jgi:RNA polymerase primary sigma factor
MAAVTEKQDTKGTTTYPAALPPKSSVTAKLSSSDQELMAKALEEPVEYVADPSFKKRSIEETLYPPDVDREAQSIDDILDEPNAVQTAMSTMTAEQERFAFRRFNYARYRVYLILRRYHRRHLPQRAVKELVFWQRRLLASRSTIVQANLPLVLAMAKRTRLNGVDFNELISEGNMALLRSVAKFDCSRGFKFSTYACRAILKSFSRVAMRASRYRGRFPTEFDPSLEKSDFLETKREEEYDDYMDELRKVLTRNLADLSDIEWTVITSRFALDAAGEDKPAPKTLEEVGSIIGVTKERVRQIQNKALRKLRLALEESIAAA